MQSNFPDQFTMLKLIKGLAEIHIVYVYGSTLMFLVTSSKDLIKIMRHDLPCTKPCKLSLINPRLLEKFRSSALAFYQIPIQHKSKPSTIQLIPHDIKNCQAVWKQKRWRLWQYFGCGVEYLHNYNMVSVWSWGNCPDIPSPQIERKNGTLAH